MIRKLGAAAAVVVALAGVARADEDQKLVDHAAEFLVKAQHEDGSFGPAFDPAAKPGEVGITALALKALAEAQLSGDLDAQRKKALEKGVAWLVSKQGADGAFNPDKSGLGTYRTALSMQALAAIDRAKHGDAINKAKAWLESGQFEDGEKIGNDSPHWGGWGYDKTGAKPDADMSNTQMAIAALREAGVGADDPVMKRAMEFIARCQNNPETNKPVAASKLTVKKDGGFFYGPSRATADQTKVENADGTVSYESYASMTYAGLVSMINAGLTKDDPRVKAALAWIKEHYTLEENHGLGVRAKNPGQAQMGLYYYYYTFARALHALGSDEVETKDGKRKWGRDLLDALKARQKKDGSWVNEADRWREGDPSLVTAYSLTAANIARKHAK